MFATSMYVHASDHLKRKSVFANDTQSWPAAYYKRPCLRRVGRDTRCMAYSGYVLSASNCVAFAVPQNASMQTTHGASVPMQREIEPDVHLRRFPLDDAKRYVVDEPVLLRKKRPAAPPRWGDFAMYMQDDPQGWDSASDAEMMELDSLGVPKRRVGFTRPRHLEGDTVRKRTT